MSTTPQIVKNGKGIVQTFVFHPEQEMPKGSRLWQILPTIFGSLMCLPFGIMLGWPSPTYPKLLAESTPIPITIDQSAMIAGFLMIGNIVGTPFSSWSFMGTKYGMVLGLVSMLIGWIIMWYATSIYCLLGSRFLIGLGLGYGIGQLKIYIKDMCEPKLSATITKLVNFYVYFGVIVAFALGTFTSFTDFSLVAIVITAVILLLCMLLPHPPKEYLRFGKVIQARTVLKYLRPNSDVDYEIQHMKMSMGAVEEEMSFFQVCRDNTLRPRLGLVAFLTFFMQFSGAPATIVYAQITFTASHCPFPEFSAIAYAVVFFASNFIGVFYFDKINRKVSLLVSSMTVTVLLAVNIVVLYFDFNGRFWSYTSLVTLFLFIFFHSTGLAVVPFMLVQEYLPAKARKVVSHFQIMQHSALALIITKIFQVLYDRFALYVPFCLFICISLSCFFFVLVFVPYKAPVLEPPASLKGSEPL